jgi:hypothetical protein
MAQAVARVNVEAAGRVPEWIYYFSDDQFVSWCRQHKLLVCDQVRHFEDDERAAIFRYALRQQLLEHKESAS